MLTPFQESIAVLSALKTTLSTDLKIIKRYPDDEDIKYSISNKMLVDLCSFLDEWNILMSLAKKDEQLFTSAKIVQPAIDRIRSWSDIRKVRNTMLAHNFRDKKTGKLTCIQTNYLDAKVPRTYAEIMLLAEFAAYAVSTILCRHQADHQAQLSAIPPYKIRDCGGIQSLQEFQSEIEALQNKIFSQDPKLRDCMGV